MLNSTQNVEVPNRASDTFQSTGQLPSQKHNKAHDEYCGDEEALMWQHNINAIHHIPVEHKTRAANDLAKGDPDVEVHAYCEYHLQDAYDYRTEMMEMFQARHIDDKLETVIWAGLEFALEAMKSEHATVSGIVVGTMRAMLWNQQTFHSYFHGPRRPYPRSVKDIEAHIEAEKIRSVTLHYLEGELEDARNLEARALKLQSE
jgi:hypothetical protein